MIFKNYPAAVDYMIDQQVNHKKHVYMVVIMIGNQKYYKVLEGVQE